MGWNPFADVANERSSAQVIGAVGAAPHRYADGDGHMDTVTACRVFLMALLRCRHLTLGLMARMKFLSPRLPLSTVHVTETVMPIGFQTLEILSRDRRRLNSCI
jgi:hypothetical protein